MLDFDHALAAVRTHARRTPLLEVDELSHRLGRAVYAKAECLQETGSFKVRGAASRLVALSTEEAERGVVACSSGNHGRAVAHIAARLGVPATIFVPEWVDPLKLDAIRRSGAEPVLAGTTFDEAEARALDDARRSGRTYVSAYDDPWVIAGQGTIAFEIVEELGGPPAALLAPVSGGGLIAGMASAMRGLEPDTRGRTRCVGVSAENAAVMVASLAAGRPVEVPEVETLASALAGGIGLDNRYSFDLVRDLVDEHVLVAENAIAEAMRYAMERMSLVVEGGGAVALAGLLSNAWHPTDLPPGPIVIVLSGGNVNSATLVDVIRGG